MLLVQPDAFHRGLRRTLIRAAHAMSMRRAFDADHISATGNTTRELWFEVNHR